MPSKDTQPCKVVIIKWYSSNFKRAGHQNLEEPHSRCVKQFRFMNVKKAKGGKVFYKIFAKFKLFLLYAAKVHACLDFKFNRNSYFSQGVSLPAKITSEKHRK